MGSRKIPGIDPLGHPPFSDVSLEGPKVHHDDHGPNASVPAKGSARAIPGEHWEMQYNPTPEGENTHAGAFLPKRSKMRPQPYDKINECDH